MMKPMNRKIKLFLGLLVFWFVLFLIWEWWISFPRVRPNPVSSPISEESKIDSVLSESVLHYILPGVAAVVVKDGKISYLKAIGFENLQTKDSLKTTSKIPIASVSKIFTALGLATHLSELGIGAHEPISVLGMGQITKSKISTVTFQALLTHTSGIRDPRFLNSLLEKRQSQPLHLQGAKILEEAKRKKGEPTLNYADANFDLIGHLISSSGKEDFDSILHASILIPSGMTASVFETSWPKNEEVAEGYHRTFLWKRLAKKRLRLSTFPSPSSGLITTPKDMSHALIHLVRGEMGIYQNALNWLQPTGDGVPFGFQEISLNGEIWSGHFGGQGGHSSLLIYSEEKEVGIFIHFNAEDKEDYRAQIASAILTIIGF
jgi:CubicO group peptidase (beta-lactamase class C family)